MNTHVKTDVEVVVFSLKENGWFPNNPELPVLLYKNAFDLSGQNAASVIEQVFERNNWTGSWKNGIYSYHHYHSTTHEALGVCSGWAEVQLGGPGQNPVRIKKGDLVVLPAGIAHKLLESGDGFAVVGAYPDDQSWDMNYGKEEEFEKAKHNIRQVALPGSDPLGGENGDLHLHWK